MNSHPDILFDAEWFPHRIDARAGSIRFLRLSREDHRTATFLSDEYLGQVQHRRDAPIPDAASLGRAGLGPLHFIFHSAFCCSTLLARALDIPGAAMGLKEPAALNDLAMAKRGGLGDARLLGLLDALLALYARPFAAGETMIIKSSNVANCLIEHCLSLRPEARAILMYSRLPTFLRSIAKKGLWGHNWSRQLFQLLQPESQLDTGFSDVELFRQSDLQIAALAWLMHHAQFAEVLQRFGRNRVRTLDGNVLVARGAETLSAAMRFLGIKLSDARVATIANGPVFRENSKTHAVDFDGSSRQDEHRLIDAARGEEIAMVVRWAEAVAKHCSVPLEIGDPLVE